MTSRRDQLNPDQALALDSMLDWLKSDSKYFLLRGSAGVGKTFVARAFADAVRGRLVFTAPTNKAAEVLSRKARGSIEVVTVAKLMTTSQ